MRVAVIGAGAAGLAVARELRQQPLLELRTNLSREVMGFLDFPFVAAAVPESVDPRRFPRHEEVLRYIQEFARRFELYDLARFRTEVTAVTAAGGSIKNQSQNHGGCCCWRVRWRKLSVADDADAADAAEEEAPITVGYWTKYLMADG